MTSIGVRTRQVSSDTGYYIPLADLRGQIYAYNAASPAFNSTTWATSAGGDLRTLPLISSAGAGLLKDMGKTVVSASRTFRKVQLVVSSVSTFGVGGNAGTSYPQSDFYTGYIELGSEGYGKPAPVALFGR